MKGATIDYAKSGLPNTLFLLATTPCSLLALTIMPSTTTSSAMMAPRLRAPAAYEFVRPAEGKTLSITLSHERLTRTQHCCHLSYFHPIFFLWEWQKGEVFKRTYYIII
jgi:hypothetical protein